MEYSELGKTGLRVSRIGFGGAPAGLKNYLVPFDPGSPDDRRRILDAIDAALDEGINFFDTAPGYGDGRSEELFGHALKGSRHSVTLASKVGVSTGEALRRSIESSLTRLQTDRLDIVQFHGTSYTERDRRLILDDNGMVDQLIQLKSEGMVRFIGFTSEDNNDAVYEFIQCGLFDMMQICYNLFMQHAYDPNRPFGSMLEAEKAGMGIAAMRTTTSGLFQRWMQAVDKENTFDYTEALIQYVLSNPYVDVALVGMRNAEQVRKNAAICRDLSGRLDLKGIFTYYL